jgi:antitoxin component of RelBE/YafQ-DinJ toxin-antitoxin module
MKINQNTITINADTQKAKNAAEILYSEYGVKVDEVLDGLFKSITNTRSLPKELIEEITYPERTRRYDEELEQTLADYKAGKIKGYSSAAEMWADLEAEDDDYEV